jgi:hypothetical protein
MHGNVTELVVYTVKDAARAAAARQLLPAILKAYDGFVAYEPLASAGAETTFVDIVRWRDLESAKAASASIMSNAKAAGFMAEIDEVKLMDHLVAAA